MPIRGRPRTQHGTSLQPSGVRLVLPGGALDHRLMRIRWAHFEGPARQRAVSLLDDAIDRFGRAGYSEAERLSPLQARLRSATGRSPVRLRMSQEGKILGGNYALEISTDEPVLPRTRGLSARGKGLVRMRGVRFRSKRQDAAGRQLAERLGSDARLAEPYGRLGGVGPLPAARETDSSHTRAGRGHADGSGCVRRRERLGRHSGVDPVPEDLHVLVRPRLVAGH